MKINERFIDSLKECSERKSTVYFSGANKDIVFQTHILSVGSEQIALKNKVPPAYIREVISSKEFYVQFEMARFIANSVETDGENIIFPLKDLVQVDETRETERFPFDQEESVICELLNPFDKTTILSKSVMDMSSAGLSLRTNFPSKLFKAGTFFDSMRVTIDGELYKAASGRVVYSRKMLDLKGKLKVQVGFQIENFK
ncbi:hypothetical protein N9D31_02325 [Oligoflexaceae bacterium]|nr:hypothetical protein [Oligoflexaceae bacterium]